MTSWHSIALIILSNSFTYSGGDFSSLYMTLAKLFCFSSHTSLEPKCRSGIQSVMQDFFDFNWSWLKSLHANSEEMQQHLILIFFPKPSTMFMICHSLFNWHFSWSKQFKKQYWSWISITCSFSIFQFKTRHSTLYIIKTPQSVSLNCNWDIWISSAITERTNRKLNTPHFLWQT